jgi:hypothetical protein
MGIELLLFRDSTAPQGFDFYIQGDLNQMGLQRKHLQTRCFIEVQQSDVRPVIKQEDVKRALTSIFNNKIEGWWHYIDKYIELEICTKEQFDEELKLSVERAANHNDIAYWHRD